MLPMKTLRTTVIPDAFTEAASKAFDYTFVGESIFALPEFAPPEGDWGILLIVGPSGSGKSSLLREHFGEPSRLEWDGGKAVISHFATPEEAIARMSSVGFNSIPAWCRPRHVLSNGEGHRVDLARSLKDGAVIDEFTSVVNREAARSTAVGVRRLVDKFGFKRVVLATCHYDIIEWLQPDWVFDTATGVMTPRGALRPRPKIELEIHAASTALWPIFAPHHYLTEKLARGANFWVVEWDGIVVACVSSIYFPHPHIDKCYREHRTVCLPDYQGLGIGVRVSDAIGQLHVDAGFRYYSRTVHPRMGEYRHSSPFWRPTKHDKRKNAGVYAAGATSCMKPLVRQSYSHEYIGNSLDKSRST